MPHGQSRRTVEVPKINFDKVEPMFEIGGGRNNRSSSSYFVSLFAQESSWRTPPRAICRRNWEITFCSRLFLLLLQLPILTPFAKSPKGFQRQRENFRGFSFSFAVRKQERWEKALRHKKHPRQRTDLAYEVDIRERQKLPIFARKKRGKDTKNIVSAT